MMYYLILLSLCKIDQKIEVYVKQRERTHMCDISQGSCRPLNLLLVSEKTHLLKRKHSQVQT